MTESLPISTESRLFDIAELLVVLRYRAERYWTNAEFDSGTDSGVLLEPLAVAVRRLLTTVLAAAASIKPSRAADRLAELAATVEGFWLHFRTEWPREARVNKLREVADVEPERAYYRDQYMFSGSPLADVDHWGKVQAVADSVSKALEPGARASFEISALLGGEVWATFAGGQRARASESDLAYLTVDFEATARQAVRSLAYHVPFVRGLHVNFSSATAFRARQRIIDLWQRTGSLLRNPAGAPGYLGLVLDRPTGQVCRAGRCRPLNGKIRWAVLVRLERSGPEFCSRDALDDVWGAGLHDPPNLATLDQVLADVRKVLRPLGVRIRNSRKIGWRLEDAPDVVASEEESSK